jgi:hypothetical protein
VTFKERIFNQFLPLIFGVVFSFLGWQMMISGFEEVQSLRQMERTPETPLNSIISGPVSVTGFAESDQLLPSRHTSTPSIYYRYTHEVERRDSEGNTYWDLVDQETRWLDFSLNDHARSVAVNADDPLNAEIDWSLPISFQTVTGDHRYTERRIEPGDKLYLSAKAESSTDGLKSHLNFSRDAGYRPIISKYDKSYEQQRMGSAGVFYLWGGLALIVFTMFCVAVLFRIHKVWQYQVLLITAVSIVLIHFSLLMMKSDLLAAQARFDEQWQFSHQRLQALDGLINRGDEVAEHERDQVTANLALNRYLLESQLNRFPEWLLAAIWDVSLDPSKQVVLNAAQQALFDRQLQKLAISNLSDGVHYAFFIIGLLLIGIGSYFGFKKIRFKRLIENIATQKTVGLVPGMVEVNGQAVLAEDEEALSSPLTFQDCCWYHYVVQEKRSSGNKTRWVTIENRKRGIDFYLQDDEGQVRVDSDDAEIISDARTVRHIGKQKHTETIIPLNYDLYIIGEAKPNPKASDRLYITEAGKQLPFIISNLTESKVMFRKAWQGLLLLNLAFMGVVVSGLLWFAQSGSFSPADFLATALFGPIYMLMFTLLLHYNDLIFLRQRAERNWINLGVALRKRKNLIPSLETVVKTYLSHEQSLMTAVADFRSKVTGMTETHDSIAGCMKSSQALTRQVNAIAEGYPELQGHEVMQKLMTELTRLETEVALLTNGYNDAVSLHNERLDTFPDIVFRWAFKFQAMELFTSGK